MVDICDEVKKLLSKPPYALCFFYPEQWNEFPVISFYDMNHTKSFSSDNEGDMSKGHIVVDIWTLEPGEGGRIAQEVTELMAVYEWWCELNKALPKTDGVYHRTLRFGKEFVL